MVLHALQASAEALRGEGAPELVLHTRALPARAQLAQNIREVGPVLGHEEQSIEPARARVAVDGDGGDVGELGARFTQAVGDGLRRESGPVLDATEALFLGGGDQLSVDQYGCRRITVIRVDPQN